MTAHKLTFKATVLSHLNKVGSISIREAMDDYGMSGGSLTKYISELRKEGVKIHKENRKHPITGRKYARYHLVSVYKTVKEDAKPVREFNNGDKVFLTANYPGLDYGQGEQVIVDKLYDTDADGVNVYRTTDGYYFYGNEAMLIVPIVTVTVTTHTRDVYPFTKAA